MNNALLFHSFDDNVNADPFYDLNLNDFKDILKSFKNKKNGNQITITFDDGFKSIIPAVEYSLENKFKTIIFISTDYLGKEGFLTDLDLKYLSSKGCIIGSHTKSHANLTKLKISLLKKELSDSKLILEKIINKKVDILSFPYGQKNKRSIKQAFLYYDFIAISRPLIFKNKSIIGRISINKSNVYDHQRIFKISHNKFNIIFISRLLILKIIKFIIPNKYYLILKSKITGNISKDIFGSN